METIIEGPHFDSYILSETTDVRDGYHRLKLVVKTYIEFHGAGAYNAKYDVEGWNGDQKREFRNAFAERIWQGWGNGAIWLYQSNKAPPPDVWCDVQIQYIEDLGIGQDDAQLCVIALMNPTPKGDAGSFRAGCSRDTKPFFGDNPFDMHIAYSGVVGKRATMKGKLPGGGDCWTEQYTVQHEFGHYLGLPHSCIWAACDTPNSDAEYCDGMSTQEQDHIMAAGNKWVYTSTMDAHGRTRDATLVGSPFKARLEAHKYAPGADITPYVANGHTDDGGGERRMRPWK